MYAKVFSQIFDSSISEDYRVRFVFEDMLKLANVDGVVDMTHEAIARRTNVPIDIVQLGISNLESPDPKSRSKEHEGRRIVRLDDHRDWGWFIVNYHHYRDLVSEEQRREKTKLRTQKWRAKKSGDAPVTLGDAPVTESTQGDAMQREMQREMEMEKGKKIHRKECVGDFKRNESENQNVELDPVFTRDLLAAYRRPAGSRLSHIEQSSLAQIIRERPRYRDEWDTIIILRQKEPRYFPQSLSRLLSAWQETLDRANNHVPASVGKTASTVFEITKVIEAKTKLADELKHKHATESALSTIWSPPEKRLEHIALRGEIKKLTNQLANMA